MGGNVQMKDRIRKGIYIRTVDPEQSNKVYNGDNPDEVRLFWKEHKAQEIERLKSNEMFISNIEHELEIYNRDIIEDLKGKNIALELKSLILSRLQVLQDTIELNDENTNRYSKAIDKSKRLLEMIDNKLLILTDIEPKGQNTERKKFDIDKTLIIRYFDYLSEDTICVDISMFFDAMEYADFSTLFSDKKTVKSKLKKFIYIASFQIKKDWYSNVAKNMNMQKGDFSGVKIEQVNWEHNLKKIKLNNAQKTV